MMSESEPRKKRQELPKDQEGHLYVVATPIGNLGDLTFRALETLESVDCILCEDTRRTAQLMAARGLSKRLERFDAHASVSRVGEMIERLKSGEQLALVTDAGTPAVSDPAAELVRSAREHQIAITPIPGPSAVTCLLSVAGFQDTAFAFIGFFPRKEGEQEVLLKKILSSPLISVWVAFESPQRIQATVARIAAVLPQAEMVVGKELTKLHEKVFAGSASQTLIKLNNEIESQGSVGEWCFAMKIARSTISEEESTSWFKALQCLIECGVSVSSASKKISQRFGIAKNQVYEAGLKIPYEKLNK